MASIAHVGKPEGLTDLPQIIQGTELTSAWSRADEAQPVPSLFHTPGSSFSLVLGPQPLGEAAALPRCCPWWAQHQVHLGLSS